MVGIVIVSHSNELAESLREMALQVGKSVVPIASAGGVDDANDPIGTDAVKILHAIEEVYSSDGVLVFMDMGSAVLSTETALDLLDKEKKKKIKLSGAPLVEGVISAVVQSASGLGIEEIMDEADKAIIPKRNQLGLQKQQVSGKKQKSDHSEENILKNKYRLKNTLGLHARPAAQIVKTISLHDASASVRNITRDSSFVNAKSMNSLITLNARQNDEVEVMTSGPESSELQSKLTSLFQKNFGESTAPAKKQSFSTKKHKIPSSGIVEGIPISAGIGIGEIYQHVLKLPDVSDEQATNTEHELKQLEKALNGVTEDLDYIIESSRKKFGDDEAAIFEAHKLLVKDPELLGKVRVSIIQNNNTAAYAWKTELEYFIGLYDNAAEGSMLSAKAVDLVDVGLRVLGYLMDVPKTGVKITENAIMVTNNLSPTDVAQIDSSKVVAICTAKGSENSHGAILARSLGIPAVFGLGEAITELPDGTTAAVDGEKGVMFIEPDKALRAELLQKKNEWIEFREKAKAQKHEPAITRDGHPLNVQANVGNMEDVHQAIEQGAEGIGLFRTEFLFMERDEAPNEDYQYNVYKKTAKMSNGNPVIIRTIDIGGDKPVPYLQMEKEENPFLGCRGIRYALLHPDLLKTQLRAILRASADGNISVMFPMISTVTELKEACSVLDECKQELKSQEIPFDQDMRVGIMVEVPSVVKNLSVMAEFIDFISLGTNDLSQYVMAADRMNPKVAHLSSHYEPALLKVMCEAVSVAKENGLKVSVCGEMARDTNVTPLLIGMGIDTFSMNALGVPEFKWHARNLNMSDSKKLLKTTLELKESEEVKSRLKSHREK